MSETNGRYTALRRYVSETPWAMLPSTLLALREVIGRRIIDGERLSSDEIADITAAAPKRQQNGKSQPSIAVLPLWGVMSPHQVSDLSSGPTSGLDQWADAFDELVNDPNVGTIVLDIDSPGGAVDLVPETAAKIRAATARKPVIAVANTRAASAAYWLASQATELIVSPSGAVGSVGVYAAHEDVSEQLAAEGVAVTLVSAGDHKVDGNPFEPLSDEARATIQANVDAFYRMFVTDVAKGRRLDVGAVEAGFGQGRMVLAGQAVQAGMADGIGTLEETITRLLKGQPATKRTRAAEVDVPALAAASSFDVAPSTFAVGADSVGPIVISFTGASPVEAQLEPLTVSGDHDFNHDSGAAPVAVGSAAPAATTTTKENTMDGEFTSVAELIARRDVITTRMSEIDASAPARSLTDDEQTEYDGLKAEAVTIKGAFANLEARRVDLALVADRNPDSLIVADDKKDRVGPGQNGSLPENLYDLGGYRGFARSLDELQAKQRDGALKIAENLKFELGTESEKTATHDRVERSIRGAEKSEFARRVIQTSNPEYDRAFGKALMRGRDALTTQEDGLIKAAISESGLGSETPIPITIDPTVMLTSNGQTNPLRAVADVRTITGLTWRGITSAGITAAYESAEGNQVADGSPTFGGGDINVLRCDAYVPFSIEVDMDWPSLRAELASEFQDAKDVLEGVKFFTGSGTNEPTGIITALTAATQLVKTALTATFAYTDPKLAANALPVRWDAAAQWFASKPIWSDLEDLYAAAGNADPFSFAANGGASASQTVRGNAGGVYRGYPMNYASAMDTALTSGKNIMVLGDPKAFVIVDRIGMNIELIPTVFGSNQRPTGQRGLFAYWRNNTGIRTVNAFEILQVR